MPEADLSLQAHIGQLVFEALFSASVASAIIYFFVDRRLKQHDANLQERLQQSVIKYKYRHSKQSELEEEMMRFVADIAILLKRYNDERAHPDDPDDIVVVNSRSFDELNRAIDTLRRFRLQYEGHLSKEVHQVLRSLTDAYRNIVEKERYLRMVISWGAPEDDSCRVQAHEAVNNAGVAAKVLRSRLADIIRKNMGE